VLVLLGPADAVLQAPLPASERLHPLAPLQV
jgi:hypothetical protein